MTVKKILTAPDPFLKQISKPVDEVTKEIQGLMDDMLDTMYDAPGIGLACLLYTSPSPRDRSLSRMPSSA